MQTALCVYWKNAASHSTINAFLMFAFHIHQQDSRKKRQIIENHLNHQLLYIVRLSFLKLGNCLIWSVALMSTAEINLMLMRVSFYLLYSVVNTYFWSISIIYSKYSSQSLILWVFTELRTHSVIWTVLFWCSSSYPIALSWCFKTFFEWHLLRMKLLMNISLNILIFL